jgi:hypothetical protein
VLVDLGRAVVYLLTSACGMHAAEMQQRPYLAATKLLDRHHRRRHVADLELLACRRRRRRQPMII